jgi:hypothetical protein
MLIENNITSTTVYIMLYRLVPNMNGQFDDSLINLLSCFEY